MNHPNDKKPFRHQIFAVLIAFIALLPCSAHRFAASAESNTPPKVSMTSDISPPGLVSAYRALGRELPGNVAVKVHTGEPRGQQCLVSPHFFRSGSGGCLPSHVQHHMYG